MTHLELTRRLRERIRSRVMPDVPVGEVPADAYLSPARFAAEQALFETTPPIVALEAELAEPGACLAIDGIVLVRGDDGVVRGFVNACRHRATRLIDGTCVEKAIVCPYHGWTYDLRGRRLHVPHEGAFAGLRAAAERDALAPVHVAARHGFVLASRQPFDADALLAPIAGDLASLDAARMTLHKKTVREVRGNWKLVIDAFLDAYHIRRLHRDTVYRFFLDAEAECEPAGPHVRAVTARRALLEAGDLEAADLRQLVTPSYLVFPTTTLVLHPDWMSVLAALPLAPGRTRFVHWMLVPEPPRTPAEAEHFTKSFALIDEGVFAAEDLRIVEAMQAGLEAGADRSILFGRHEHAALRFHAELDALLNEA